MDGEVIEEIRDFLEWGGGKLVGNTRSEVVCLVTAVLTLADVFFFVLLAAGSVAAVDLVVERMWP